MAVGEAIPERPWTGGTLLWLGMMLALLFAFALELAVGSVTIPPGKLLAALFQPGPLPEDWRQILYLFRLPRALTATLAGAALGIAGLKMQTLFRNPLADPFVLGISSGAGLGVALIVMAASWLQWPMLLERTGLSGNVSLVLAAVLGAAAVMGVVLGIARRVESNVTLLLVGLMVGYITSAVVQILMQLAAEHELQSYVAWTFGTFGSVTWDQMSVFAPTVICGLAGTWALIKPLNALLLGNDYARSMGVNVRLARYGIILGAALLAGAVTAYCGPVGFLGIAVPHLGRVLLRTTDHRRLVPAVMLLGAIGALFADLISQMPGTQLALPLNAVTALIGAPVVVAVILRRRHVLEVDS